MATVQDVLARVRAKHERFAAEIGAPDLLRRAAGRHDAPTVLTDLAEAVAAGRTTWAAVLDGPGTVPEIRRLFDGKNMAEVSAALERTRADDAVQAPEEDQPMVGPAPRRRAPPVEDFDPDYDPVFETREEADNRIARQRDDTDGMTRQEHGWSW